MLHQWNQHPHCHTHMHRMQVFSDLHAQTSKHSDSGAHTHIRMRSLIHHLFRAAVPISCAPSAPTSAPLSFLSLCSLLHRSPLKCPSTSSFSHPSLLHLAPSVGDVHLMQSKEWRRGRQKWAFLSTVRSGGMSRRAVGDACTYASALNLDLRRFFSAAQKKSSTLNTNGCF